jgi:UDP-N-acetylmuramate--alanine ligase
MKVYFIGIGGIGISSLAQYYISKGDQVFGSDLVKTEITDLLVDKGVKVTIGETGEYITEDLDLIIYTPAVADNNPELLKAKSFNIKCMSYPEALGLLTKDHFTIAVSGSHGKSTTTAMVAKILIEAKLDPTVIIGTKLKEFNDTNFRKGESQYLVIEADEYKASFLNYNPDIIIYTNIEAEHLDFYGNIENILEIAHKYINNLKENGILIYNFDDKNLLKVTEDIEQRKIPFGLDNTYNLENILQVPGDHFVSDALGALMVARQLGIKDEISFKALSEYKGAWRRFEVKELDKFTLVSDYAHHPTEIRATLTASRKKWPDKEIIVVYQPHQYQRTYHLFNDLVDVFKKADVNKVVLVPIYDVAGRETRELKEQVSSEKLQQEINKDNVIYLDSLDLAKEYLDENIKGGEIVFIMGAGDIYDLTKRLK